MRGRGFRLTPGALVATSVALHFSHSSVWANPTGPQVVNGAVAISELRADIATVGGAATPIAPSILGATAGVVGTLDGAINRTLTVGGIPDVSDTATTSASAATNS